MRSLSLRFRIALNAMSAFFGRYFALPARLWAILFGFLTARNERAVDEWGASLQYKRRYTNPEDAKRFRRGP